MLQILPGLDLAMAVSAGISCVRRFAVAHSG
jgi:hypothetical protein